MEALEQVLCRLIPLVGTPAKSRLASASQRLHYSTRPHSEADAWHHLIHRVSRFDICSLVGMISLCDLASTCQDLHWMTRRQIICPGCLVRPRQYALPCGHKMCGESHCAHPRLTSNERLLSSAHCPVCGCNLRRKNSEQLIPRLTPATNSDPSNPDPRTATGHHNSDSASVGGVSSLLAGSADWELLACSSIHVKAAQEHRHFLVLCDINRLLVYRHKSEVALQQTRCEEVKLPPDFRQQPFWMYIRPGAPEFVRSMLEDPHVIFSFYTSISARNVLPMCFELLKRTMQLPWHVNHEESVITVDNSDFCIHVFDQSFMEPDLDEPLHEGTNAIPMKKDLLKVWGFFEGRFSTLSTCVIDTYRPSQDDPACPRLHSKRSL